MIVTINVTQMHINMARGTIPVPLKYLNLDMETKWRDFACSCPIDFALYDTLGPGWLSGIGWAEKLDPEGKLGEVRLPTIAREFIRNYDFGGYSPHPYPRIRMTLEENKEIEQRWHAVKPFSFKLNISAHLIEITPAS